MYADLFHSVAACREPLVGDEQGGTDPRPCILMSWWCGGVGKGGFGGGAGEFSLVFGNVFFKC